MLFVLNKIISFYKNNDEQNIVPKISMEAKGGYPKYASAGH